MRSSIVSVLGLVTTTMIGMMGCGDSEKATPDAAMPDAPPAAMFKGYDADEGGEIRIEHVRFVGFPPDPAAVANGTRIVAYMYANPGTTKFNPFPMVPGCTDTTMRKQWPLAVSADRTYLNLGDILISSPTSNTNATPKKALTMAPQAAMGGDFLARVHPAGKWFTYFNQLDGDDFLTPNAFLDIIITGSAEFPGQVLHNVSWMPNDFQLTSPAGNAPVALKANTAITFKWAVPTQNKPADMTIVSLVGFVGANPATDGPAVLCIEPDDGEVTVPGNMIDVVRAKYPAGGLMARQTFTHVPKEIVDKNGPTGRRWDVISTWCYASPYSVVP